MSKLNYHQIKYEVSACISLAGCLDKEFPGWKQEDEDAEVRIYTRTFQLGDDIVEVINQIRPLLESDPIAYLGLRGGSGSVILFRDKVVSDEVDWRDLFLLGPLIGAFGLAFGFPVIDLFKKIPDVVNRLSQTRKHAFLTSEKVEETSRAIATSLKFLGEFMDGTRYTELEPDEGFDDHLDPFDWWCNHGGYSQDWSKNHNLGD